MNKIKLKSICTLLIFLMVMIFSSQVFGYEREIKDLSEKMAGKIDQSGKKSVAVVDFTDLQGNVTELGRFIAEELSVELMSNVKKIEIIDRNHLKSIMKEHNFSMSGLVDPTTIKKVGQIVGVDAIITGSVTPFGDNIRLTCKVIATDTAKVITAGKIDIAKTKAIDELLAKEINDGGSIKSVKEKKPIRQQEKALEKRESNIRTYEDFTFELKEVRLSTSDKEMKIVLEVENKGQDKKILFESLAFMMTDNFGNIYQSGVGRSNFTSIKAVGPNDFNQISPYRIFVFYKTYDKGTITYSLHNISPHIEYIKSLQVRVDLKKLVYENIQVEKVN